MVTEVLELESPFSKLRHTAPGKRWVPPSRRTLKSIDSDAMSQSSVGHDASSTAPTPQTMDLATECRTHLASNRYQMRLCKEGEGGTYFVYDVDEKKNVAVFKPADEEIGCAGNPKQNTDEASLMKPAFAPGTGYAREVLAYELDHGHLAGIPETVEFKYEGSVGSLQRFVQDTRQSWSAGPGKIDVDGSRHIAMFDIRTLNADRHGGNILVRIADLVPVPIDHSYILPPTYCEPDFEWLTWPQCAKPFTDDELVFIKALDGNVDAALVEQRLPQEPGAAFLLRVGTMLLKTGAARGYTLTDIGEYCRRELLTQPSGLERDLQNARRSLDDGGEVDLARLQQLFDKGFPLKK
jgi:hypothetical protein